MREFRMALSFAAEKMLGRLSKWLRILGFDTIYEGDFRDGRFSCLATDRIVLTRRASHRRKESGKRTIVIRSDHYWEQLAEVVQAAGITAGCVRFFSRCIRCNLPIMPADKTDLPGKVPDYVREAHEAFGVCPRCRRIYWPGSHPQRSLQRIGRLFEKPSAARRPRASERPPADTHEE